MHIMTEVYMKRDAFLNFIIISSALLIGAVILWLFGKYILACLVPFIIAYLVSLGIKPLAAFVSEKTRLKHSFCAAVLIIIAIVVLSAAATWLISALVTEGRGLAVYIGEKLSEEDNFLRRAFDWFQDIKGRFHFGKGETGEVSESVYSALTSVAESGLSQISSGLGTFAAKFIGGLPSFIFGLITTVIALFYICLDRGGLRDEFELFAGTKAAGKLSTVKSRVLSAFGKYFKSYMIIMLVTFAQLLLGFVILRVEYALVLAFIIAIIDLLPVLGSGTVLVPWGIISLIFGDIRRGAGLIILWLIMYIVRQIIEPHIIGSVMGIHPLVSLFSVYVGFVLFGVGGMIFVPILVYFAKIIATEKNQMNSGRRPKPR